MIVNFIKKVIIPNLAISIFVAGTVAASSVAAYKLSQKVPNSIAGITDHKNSDDKKESENSSLASMESTSETGNPNDSNFSENLAIGNSEPSSSADRNNNGNSTSSSVSQTQTLSNVVIPESKSAQPQNVPAKIQPAAPSVNAVASSASAGGFTTATLAVHNKSGDCYVAFSGKVYNLNNVAAWSGCSHHGMRGGVDITSVFPHSTSYFNSIPVVGVMGSAGGTTSPTTNPAVQNPTFIDRRNSGDDDFGDDNEFETEDD